jgi:hypothetical protein
VALLTLLLEIKLTLRAVSKTLLPQNELLLIF